VKQILIYSGGLDSTTLLYHLRGGGHELRCLGIDYGQRHGRELDSANDICQRLDVPFRREDLRSIQPLLAGSALTDSVPVPHGHYTAESMKQTVVPNRNMIMLAVAIGWAVSLKFDAVAYAAHAGDHAIYPDCRPEFIETMDRAAGLCDWHRVHIERPFVNKTKTDIVQLGAQLGVPFELTWSCYEGVMRHCGKCGTCVERPEAFALAGVIDPTDYDPI